MLANKRLPKPSILLLALLTLTLLYIYLPAIQGWKNVYFYSDDAIYAVLSQRFLSGNFLEAVHPVWNPGFPIASVPFYLLVHRWETSQILVSVTSHILLIFAIYNFMKRYSKNIALISAFVTAFSLSFYLLVIQRGITEPLYILLMWLSVSNAYISITQKTYKHSLLAGFYFALSYITRTDILGIFITVLGVISIIALLETLRFHKITTLKIFIVLILSFIITLSPYIGILSYHLGTLSFSGKGAFMGAPPPFALDETRNTTFMQDVDSIDNPNYKSPYFDSSGSLSSIVHEFTKGSGIYFTKKYTKEILVLFRSKNTNYFFSGISFWTTLIGFALSLLSKKTRPLGLFMFITWLGGLLWVAAFMGTNLRYSMYALPFFFVYTSFGIDKLSKLYKPIYPIIVLLLFAEYFITNVGPDLSKDPNTFARYSYNKTIGDWIKENKLNKIGARQEAFAYYGNSTTTYIPASTPDKVIDYMKDWDTRYIVIRPDDAGYDYMKPLVDPQYTNPDLKLIKQFSDGTIVWEIL